MDQSVKNIHQSHSTRQLGLDQAINTEIVIETLLYAPIDYYRISTDNKAGVVYYDPDDLVKFYQRNSNIAREVLQDHFKCYQSTQLNIQTSSFGYKGERIPAYMSFKWMYKHIGNIPLYFGFIEQKTQTVIDSVKLSTFNRYPQYDIPSLLIAAYSEPNDINDAVIGLIDSMINIDVLLKTLSIAESYIDKWTTIREAIKDKSLDIYFTFVTPSSLTSNDQFVEILDLCIGELKHNLTPVINMLKKPVMLEYTNSYDGVTDFKDSINVSFCSITKNTIEAGYIFDSEYAEFEYDVVGLADQSKLSTHNRYFSFLYKHQDLESIRSNIGVGILAEDMMGNMDVSQRSDEVIEEPRDDSMLLRKRLRIEEKKNIEQAKMNNEKDKIIEEQRDANKKLKRALQEKDEEISRLKGKKKSVLKNSNIVIF